MNKKYKGFTLVEMLIVMGILSVLMGIGVAVARFAIQRANNIQHQSSVDQLYQAFQSYYTDHRKYPDILLFTNFATALAENGGGVLDPYVDASFDGGSPADYYYFATGDASSANQSFLVCVSFSPNGDEAGLGGYCNGNGFGVLPSGTTGTKVAEKVIAGGSADDQFSTLIDANCTTGNFCVRQKWDKGGTTGVGWQ